VQIDRGKEEDVVNKDLSLECTLNTKCAEWLPSESAQELSNEWSCLYAFGQFLCPALVREVDIGVKCSTFSGFLLSAISS
jgi:hypothetical protein